MEIKCFACDVQIEAHDVDAFVAHGRDRHTGSYSDDAIRTYARNYAEATGRLTGSTERLEEIAAIIVHPVTTERIDDCSGSSTTMGSPASPTGPRAIASSPTFLRRPSNRNAPGAKHDAPSPNGFAAATTFGYLAYVDGQPVGWVNASLRADYGLYRHVDPDGPDPSSVIGVSGVPDFRHHSASAIADPANTDAIEIARDLPCQRATDDKDVSAKPALVVCV